ncbi:omptin family outer membrane protease [Shimwellia pseudoproteus]|uniref:omptin family outer membrane protease n=1 Tax=Shimwellia pseudoproteus TaxID=570012 RepID=UPI0018EACB7C|nr:omptin family outer membrane protease [Shimwellia pseudoproteus]MBJ3816104.1 omptin family outer membrane protease [Shimwellia pseudoproteus]
MKKTVIAAAMLSAPLAFPALADTLFTPQNVTGGLNVGTLSGETKERVYAPDEGGRKLSQLNWKYKNAAVLKGHIDWDLMPWVTLGASGWTTFASKGSHMDDYDWLNANQKDWTDHSSHPNTTLSYANQFDLNAKGWFITQPDWRLGVMAGYQESRYSFYAKGGHHNYANGTDVGDFPAGLKVIGYQQHYKMPYIGLTGNYRYEKIEASATFKYSPWARASDTDKHYLRDMTFHEKTRHQDFYSLEGNVGYWLTDHAKIYIDAAWSRVENKKGSQMYYDGINDTVGGSSKASGIENYNFITSVGLDYRF